MLHEYDQAVTIVTDHDDISENASRVKLTAVPEDAQERLVVMWEVWGPQQYRDTRVMVVGPGGEVLSPAASLGDKVRLGRRDDPFQMAGGVATVAGTSAGDNELVVTILFP